MMCQWRHRRRLSALAVFIFLILLACCFMLSAATPKELLNVSHFLIRNDGSVVITRLATTLEKATAGNKNSATNAGEPVTIQHDSSPAATTTTTTTTNDESVADPQMPVSTGDVSSSVLPDVELVSSSSPDDPSPPAAPVASESDLSGGTLSSLAILSDLGSDSDSPAPSPPSETSSPELPVIPTVPTCSSQSSCDSSKRSGSSASASATDSSLPSNSVDSSAADDLSSILSLSADFSSNSDVNSEVTTQPSPLPSQSADSSSSFTDSLSPSSSSARSVSASSTTSTSMLPTSSPSSSQSSDASSFPPEHPSPTPSPTPTPTPTPTIAPPSSGPGSGEAADSSSGRLSSSSTPPTKVPAPPKKSGGNRTTIIIVVVVVVVVVLLLVAALLFYRFFLGGTFCRSGSKEETDDDFADSSDDSSDADTHSNPLMSSRMSARNVHSRNYPPCVADLPAHPIRIRGDPGHINCISNHPYTVDGVVPWTGRPPVLRGPQPPCVVPTTTPNGDKIPFQNRVMPGEGLCETPPTTCELPPSPKHITKRQEWQNKWRARFGMKPFTDTIYPAPPRWYEGDFSAEWLSHSPSLSDCSDNDKDDREDEGTDSDSPEEKHIEQSTGDADDFGAVAAAAPLPWPAAPDTQDAMRHGVADNGTTASGYFTWSAEQQPMNDPSHFGGGGGNYMPWANGHADGSSSSPAPQPQFFLHTQRQQLPPFEPHVHSPVPSRTPPSQYRPDLYAPQPHRRSSPPSHLFASAPPQQCFSTLDHSFAENDSALDTNSSFVSGANGEPMDAALSFVTQSRSSSYYTATSRYNFE